MMTGIPFELMKRRLSKDLKGLTLWRLSVLAKSFWDLHQ
jgi:hypothetical protein